MEMKIEIDISDWHDEVVTSNIELHSIEDVVDAMQEMSIKPLAAARHLIVSRESGKADANVLPQNKLLLMTGGALEVNRRIDNLRRVASLNGKDYVVREFVATVTTSPNHKHGEMVYDSSMPMLPKDATLVCSDDEVALDRAENYLMTNVTGRIRERLLIIALGKGDVDGVAERLKNQIDSIVSEFKA